MNRNELKGKARDLRTKGKTYFQIQNLLNCYIPKSTLSNWCKELSLPLGYEDKIREYNKFNLAKARKIALEVKKKQKEDYLKDVDSKNCYLAENLKNKNIAKIVLATLYLAEGSKSNCILTIGNSDPLIIKLFLNLLRFCYKLDESKFRCTVQCRADQNIKELEEFWSNITLIALKQFYKARIDQRSVNKPTIKKNYKGVCRIDYFSSKIFVDLMSIAKIICMGH